MLLWKQLRQIGQKAVSCAWSIYLMPFVVQRANIETLKDHGEVGRPFFKLKVLFESVDGVRR